MLDEFFLYFLIHHYLHANQEMVVLLLKNQKLILIFLTDPREKASFIGNRSTLKNIENFFE